MSEHQCARSSDVSVGPGQRRMVVGLRALNSEQVWGWGGAHQAQQGALCTPTLVLPFTPTRRRTSPLIPSHSVSLSLATKKTMTAQK
jgi:hypothetical protein